MYEKVQTSLSFAEREQAVLDFWKEHDIFNASITRRKDAPVYTFYDGPPTANGKPHIGHIITRAVKDLIPRYKTMKGFRVPRKAGWDTHGLPVELEVEKLLGISGKPDIEKYGVEPFIKQCKESVWKYENLWRQMSERVGFWADMDDPYVTYHNSYIESVWWALKQIWDKGLMYKGYRVVPYCPRCGTPLSSHEVAQGYKDVKEVSAFVKFRAADSGDFYLAWTTTPWTLPSNVGLCVNARVEYARVKSGGEVYVMAKALLDEVLNEPYEVLETFPGARLNGKKYLPLYPAGISDGQYCTVVCDDYVTLTDGTGIVHIAPAFGEDDSRVSKANGLPFVQLVDTQGKFVHTPDAPWKGLFVKDADPLIMADMKNSGKLYRVADYEHSYPFCWRCDTPLLYYARDAWFIKMTALRDRLVENNNTVNWLPDNIRVGRFGNFLENVVDWSISRERYWGTPLPVWECACGHRHCVGSIEELKQMGTGVPGDIELHKPYIDAVKLACPVCGGEMKRTLEVIDCWFDSGAMFFAQWHYPFENADIFKEQFPADFISEAIDQTRGWFYSLIAISTLLFDCSCYKNVIVLGHGLDEKGQKMSKSKGNYTDPMDALAKHGADAVRWYLYINSAPWLNFRFFDDAVSEAQRKFMGTLWNTYAFYVLYAEIDAFNPYEYEWETESLPLMDRWVLSKLNNLIKKIDGSLERLELTEPARALNSFTDELSNWYVRRCRERFWGKDMPRDKINAYLTLHHVLVTVAKLSAPFVPFMTELMYQNLVRGLDKSAPLSIHLCDYPAADGSMTDGKLEKDMDAVLDIVTLGRAARNAANIKNRQPLPEILVNMSERGGALDKLYADIITDELNIKRITFTEDTGGYTRYRFKPQLRTLGPRYGKLVPQITGALNENGNSAMEALRAGTWKKEIEGVEVELTMEDVLVETTQKEGYTAQSDRGLTVVLDIQLTPELIEEGFTRELVSKIQTMRKEAGFDVTDRINVFCGKNAVLNGVIARNCDTISGEVLAESVGELTDTNCGGGYEKEWVVNGEKIVLGVKKA
ncbi:MAG: isoleucine--tRNA ligase [Clostridiales bacterium]|jgi:isoleucyl-tRNA synthetase|nr:isoleucine--tRNA ligase [Clostridiales bacterium]